MDTYIVCHHRRRERCSFLSNDWARYIRLCNNWTRNLLILRRCGRVVRYPNDWVSLRGQEGLLQLPLRPFRGSIDAMSLSACSTHLERIVVRQVALAAFDRTFARRDDGWVHGEWAIWIEERDVEGEGWVWIEDGAGGDVGKGDVLPIVGPHHGPVAVAARRLLVVWCSARRPRPRPNAAPAEFEMRPTAIVVQHLTTTARRTCRSYTLL